MNVKKTPIQDAFDDFAAADERYRAELAQNPQQAAMLKAMQPTKAETAEREAAEAAVLEAEKVVGDAMLALGRAERGQPEPPRGFKFFQTSKDSHKAAVVAASIPDLRVDLEEARSALQAAIRRRNTVAARIDQARMERRRTAKLKHAPKLDPVQSRGDGWMHKGLGDVA